MFCLLQYFKDFLIPEINDELKAQNEELKPLAEETEILRSALDENNRSLRELKGYFDRLESPIKLSENAFLLTSSKYRLSTSLSLKVLNKKILLLIKFFLIFSYSNFVSGIFSSYRDSSFFISNN